LEYTLPVVTIDRRSEIAVEIRGEGAIGDIHHHIARVAIVVTDP
jgi:hypothetical protein